MKETIMKPRLDKQQEPQSQFFRMLAANPDLAAKCDAIAEESRNAAMSDIEACRKSGQIGPNDLDVIINVRTDNL
jgi:hypothetical protein